MNGGKTRQALQRGVFSSRECLFNLPHLQSLLTGSTLHSLPAGLHISIWLSCRLPVPADGQRPPSNPLTHILQCHGLPAPSRSCSSQAFPKIQYVDYSSIGNCSQMKADRASYRAVVGAVYIAGIAAFVKGLWPLTEPRLFGGSLFW